MPSLVNDPRRPSHKKKWRARVRFHWTEYCLGRFDTYEEAKAAEETWWAKRGYVNGKRPWRNAVDSG